MKQPRIFYFCPSTERPFGGIKQAYRHVDILNRYGFSAYVVHLRKRFRVRWFENDTPIVSFDRYKSIHDPKQDFTVVPELYPEQKQVPLLSFPGKKVLFNQNVFYGFFALGVAPRARPAFLDTSVKAVLTVSGHNTQLLRFAFPKLPLIQLPLGVDDSRFTFRSPLDKKPQIACCVKDAATLATILWMLRSRADAGLNELRRVRWVLLQGMSESEVARAYRESLIFIFLGVNEGSPLMPVEAMLSGCLVTALDGGPASDYLPKAYVFARRDLRRLITAIEGHFARYRAKDPGLLRLARQGLAAAKRFSMRREEQAVARAWSKLLSS